MNAKQRAKMNLIRDAKWAIASFAKSYGNKIGMQDIVDYLDAPLPKGLSMQQAAMALMDAVREYNSEFEEQVTLLPPGKRAHPVSENFTELHAIIEREHRCLSDC